MANERVGITVNTKFTADTTEAKAAFEEFTRSSTQAAAYGHMTEVQQLQYVMQKLPEVMQSNPGLLTSMVQGVGKGAGTGMQSMMAQAFFTGMNAAKLGAFHSSLYDTLRGKGVDESRLQGMETLDLWAEVMRRSPTEGRQILNGTISTGTLTDVERDRTLGKMNLEDWSASFSKGSMGMRLGIKGLLIQKAIQEQSGTPRAGAPSRPRLLAPRI